MPVPPSPLLDETIAAGQPGHIADHEKIADALNNDTMSLAGDQSVLGIKTFAAGSFIDQGSEVYNVVAYGAVGDAATDDTTAIQDAIDDAPQGSVIYFPVGSYKLTSTLTVTKALHFKGADWLGANFVGSGLTMMSVTGAAAVGCTFRDLYFQFTASNASNIGLLLGDGTNGCTYFLIERCRFHGVGSAGLGNNGVGISTNFALEGTIRDTRIEFFGKGVVLDGAGANQSNANLFSGCLIRQNLVGVDQVLAQDVAVVGGTIEGNGTGWQKASGTASFYGTHFENNAGAQKDITNSAGTVRTTNCTFDFSITLTGAGNLISLGDVLEDVTNSGTGFARIVMLDPSNSFTTSGNVSIWKGDTITTAAGQTLTFIGQTNAIIEHATSANLQIKSTSNTGFSQLYFARANLVGPGRIYYDHTNNALVLEANAAEFARGVAGGLTMAAGKLLLTAASATGGAGLRVPHGTAPTSPVNGDVWTTTAGLYVQINGSAVGPLS